MSGVFGRSRYLISITSGPSAPRVLSSLALPRLSQARRRPDSKHSARNAKTSNTVDFPLPLGPSSTVIGVNFLSSTSRSARKFCTRRYSILTGGNEEACGMGAKDYISSLRHGREGQYSQSPCPMLWGILAARGESPSFQGST